MLKFHLAIKYELLNPNKFKLPKPKDDIVKFVDDDCSFIITAIKQQFVQ